MNTFMTKLDKLDAEYQDELPLVQLAIQASMIAHAAPTFSEADPVHFGSEPDGSRSVLPLFPPSGLECSAQSAHLCPSQPSFTLGHPDTQVQRMISRNDHEGSSTFGKLLHKFAVGLPAAQAMRNVQDDCAQILRADRELPPDADHPRCRILVLTYGPSIEWLEVLWNPAFTDIALTIQDSDPLSLSAAATWIKKLELVRGVSLDVTYRQVPQDELVTVEKRKVPREAFEFIFALGLLDTVNDTKAKVDIGTLFSWLPPGGEVLLTNAVSENQEQLLSECWNDSRVHDRSEPECRDLVLDLRDSASTLTLDPTKIEMLFRVSRSPASL